MSAALGAAFGRAPAMPPAADAPPAARPRSRKWLLIAIAAVLGIAAVVWILTAEVEVPNAGRVNRRGAKGGSAGGTNAGQPGAAGGTDGNEAASGA